MVRRNGHEDIGVCFDELASRNSKALLTNLVFIEITSNFRNAIDVLGKLPLSSCRATSALVVQALDLVGLVVKVLA